MFLVPLLLPFLLVEMVISVTKGSGHETLFPWLAENKQASIDHLFLGSSLTLLCIDSPGFDEEVLKDTGKKIRSLNMGMGYSTAAEYYLGLRYLIAHDKNALRNKVVFMEAPAGLPVFSSWRDDWMDAKHPRLLTYYLDWSDIWKYWTLTNASFGEKVYLPLAKYSSLASYGPVLQELFMQEINTKLKWLSPAQQGLNSKTSPRDLAAVGGVRTDDEGVEAARRSVAAASSTQLKNQTAINWNDTIVADIVKLVHANGGKVYFLNVPVSTVFKRRFETAIRTLDKQEFEKMLDQWNCKIIEPKFSSTGDEDFPDLLHLRASRSPEFSRAAADAYSKHIESTPTAAR